MRRRSKCNEICDSPNPSAGSDVASINTTATLSASGAYYAVSGSKKWITNGLFADYMTTAVRTSPNALSVLIVPLSSPGVSRHRIPTSGCRASGTALITLNNVRVPVGNLLGKEGDGFKLVMSNFNSERLSLSITAIRLSRVCWGEAWSWANRRTTFGKPLIERQVIRAKFAKVLNTRLSLRTSAYLLALDGERYRELSRMARTIVLAYKGDTESMGGCPNRCSSRPAKGPVWTINRNVLSRSAADIRRVCLATTVFCRLI